MPNDDDVGTLKKQIAALQAQVAQLEHMQGRRVIPGAPVEERGVTITEIIPTSGFVMPSDEQLKRLGAIVIAKVAWVADVSGPGLYGSDDQRVADWMKQDRASFKALGAFKRTAGRGHSAPCGGKRPLPLRPRQKDEGEATRAARHAAGGRQAPDRDGGGEA